MGQWSLQVDGAIAIVQRVECCIYRIGRCCSVPAITAVALGYSSYAVIDASGGFSKTQVDMSVLRMVQAGVIWSEA